MIVACHEEMSYLIIIIKVEVSMEFIYKVFISFRNTLKETSVEISK